MRVKDRRRKKRSAAFAVALAAGCAVFLGGCSGSEYERIERNREDESDETALEARIVIETEAPTEAEPVAEDVTILFGGAVMLSDYVLQAYDGAGGIEGILDEGYRSAIEQADFFMVNEEFPFSDRGKAADKQYTYRLAPERIQIFEEMGIDAVTLANNHALDYGQDALLDTIDILDEAGILHTGAGDDLEPAKEPVRIDLGNGRSMAVVGMTRVIPQADWAAWKGHGGMFSTYDVVLDEALEQIRALKESDDYVAVFVHWGEERSETPNKTQQNLAHQYVEAGADLVIGAHPHVLQGVEYYEGVPIFYSLGNFLFGSSIPQTMLLEVTVHGTPQSEEDASEGTLSLRLIPGTGSLGSTRMLTESSELAAFREKMTKLSDGVSFGEDGTVTSGTGAAE
ncbi:MAG: CapA family protein [Clostridiales bacterium]|nr:CapA family protein [Clostridiales bacterium]